MSNLDQNTNNQTSDYKVKILYNCKRIIEMLQNYERYIIQIQKRLANILQLELKRKYAVIRQILKERRPVENKFQSDFESLMHNLREVDIVIERPLPKPTADVLEKSIPTTFEDVTHYEINLETAIRIVQATLPNQLNTHLNTKKQCIKDKEQKYAQLESLNTKNDNVDAHNLLKYTLLKGIVLDNLTIQFHVCNEKLDEMLFKQCKELVVHTRELAWVTWDVPNDLNKHPTYLEQHHKKIDFLRTSLKDEFIDFALRFANRNANNAKVIFKQVLDSQFKAYKSEVNGYTLHELDEKYTHAYAMRNQLGREKMNEQSTNKPEESTVSLYISVYDKVRLDGYEHTVIDSSLDELLKKELELKVLILQRVMSERSWELERNATRNLNNPEYIEANTTSSLNKLRATVKSRRKQNL